MYHTRPTGVAISGILLHVLNFVTVIFIRWNEPDTPVLAALFVFYICFTAIVIHAFWQGHCWAPWVILIRFAIVLADSKLLFFMAGLQLAQGVVERVLAPILLVYLNLREVRGWFGPKTNL